MDIQKLQQIVWSDGAKQNPLCALFDVETYLCEDMYKNARCITGGKPSSTKPPVAPELRTRLGSIKL